MSFTTDPPWIALWPVIYLAAVTPALIVGDVRTRRLANRLVLPGFAVIGMTLVATIVVETPRTQDALRSLGAGATVLGITWLVARAGALGMGDVKLAGLLAAILARADVGLLLPAAVATMVIAGVWATVVCLTASARGHNWRGTTIPLGVPLLAGFWIAFVLAV